MTNTSAPRPRAAEPGQRVAASPSAPTATPTQREGDRGPAVAKLQRSLSTAGYTVKADGAYGPKTRAAVERLQRDRGLAVDGVAGAEVARALSGAKPMEAGARALSELPADTRLAEGARGEGVRRLQERLVKHGAKIEVDGVYGAQTRGAVSAYQKAQGLVADGVAGPQTLGSLVRTAPTSAAASVDRSSSRARAQATTGARLAGPVGGARDASSTNAVSSKNPKVVTDARLIKDLAPVRGSARGSAEMAIFDNPETIHDFGVVGSTIARMKDRSGDTVHDFDGKARLYSIVNNQTQNTLLARARRQFGQDQLKNIHNSVVVHNPTNKPLVIHVEGVVYSKGITRTDGRIPESYRRNGGFRGPQAIAADAFMQARPGVNGYVKKALTIPPGGTRVVSDVYQAPGGEVFTLLDMKANGKFRMAQVASEKMLTDADLQRITRGDYPSAGAALRIQDSKSDFAKAGDHLLGRPNGVAAGSMFVGGGRVDVSARHGELLMATAVKKSESGNDIQALRKVPGNKGWVGTAATQNDGAYGMTYDLRYQLENNSNKARTVQLVLTSPRHGNETPFNPDGGMLTLPVKLDGKQLNLRVSARGTGIVMGTVEIPPGSRRDLRLELTNLGNIYPPIGLEFRPVP